MRRVLYLDLVGGAAGDMLLAALVDAGADLELVRAEVAKLGLDDVQLALVETRSAGLSARRIDVIVRGLLADGPASIGEHHGAHAAHALLRNDPGDAAQPTSQAHGPYAAHPPDPTGPAQPRDAAYPVEAGHRGGLGHPRDATYPVEATDPVRSAHAEAFDPSSRQPGHRDESGQGNAPEGVHHPHHPHDHHGPHRPYPEVRRLLLSAGLTPEVQRLSLEVFRRLAEAEARAHALPLDAVVFHEVGADDALADVVGVAAAVVQLAPEEIVASPVPLGLGLTQGAHGPIPLPAPATLSLLLGVPCEETSLRGETVTPTGAALLRVLVTRFGPIPSMVVRSVGVGAGRRSWPDRPNVVRALLGDATAAAMPPAMEDLLMEANIDDMAPHLLPDLEHALFRAGAADVFWAPIHMKKGRGGFLVSALARRSLETVLAEAFFANSTTLGLRVQSVTRIRVPRKMVTVETPFGRVAVKLSEHPSQGRFAMPEHDDCVRLAGEAGVAVRRVLEDARAAALALEEP